MPLYPEEEEREEKAEEELARAARQGHVGAEG